MNLPTNQDLDAINFDWVKSAFIECPERAFVDAPSGVEHYRLLYWLSMNHNFDSVELGTYMGFGAYCLAAGPRSSVYTYDTHTSPVKWKSKPKNINRLLVPNEDAFPNNIDISNLVFVDTWHNGEMENAVFSYLRMKKWKGVLIFDDIYYNNAMTLFWQYLVDMACDTLEVIDATDIGHATGTGIIIMK